MKASILFVCSNQERFVEEAIRSAMAQDYPDLELVVCDNDSTDRTRDVLEHALRDCPPHISVRRAHSPHKLGRLAHFNHGMAACSGAFVVVMSGDDVSMPQRVSRIAAEFSSKPRCMLVYSGWQRINDEGTALRGRGGQRQNKTFAYGANPKDLYAGSNGLGSTAAYRREIFQRFGPLELGRSPEDRSYGLRALLLGEVRDLAEPLILWRSHTSKRSHSRPGVDDAPTRRRILRDLRHSECFGRQFLKDIDLADAQGWIPAKLAERLRELITRELERERLRRYSLAEVPWPLWWASAWRVIFSAPGPRSWLHLAFSEWPVRAHQSWRERCWAVRIRKASA